MAITNFNGKRPLQSPRDYFFECSVFRIARMFWTGKKNPDNSDLCESAMKIDKELKATYKHIKDGLV